MLNLTTKPKLANVIPAHLTTLSVSWLNDQFKAVAVHRGVVAGNWERPGETAGPDGFEAFIREAVQQTGYHGHTVSLLLAHPRLMQQLVDVPPVKGDALNKIIQRQVQQQKMFPGEAAWASQTSLASNGTQRIVLHLFPRLLLDQLIQGCKSNGLHLTSVLPASAVLHQQLTRLPLAEEGLALLAAATGGSTTLVVGRSDGQMLLARTLPGDWNEEAGRLAVDLNRTILYVNQQCGGDVNPGVWLFGPGAPEQSPTVQGQLQSPVKVSPVEYAPFYWATEAAKLRPELSPNFISELLQKAPQRRIFATGVVAATVVVVAGSLAASAYFTAQARQEAANIKVLSGQLTQLGPKQEELQRLDRELSGKSQLIKLIISEQPPPTPAWLVAYLGASVPSDLVITNLQIKREEDLWKLKLAGAPQTVKLPKSLPMSNAVALLKTRLAGAPFHLQILDDEEKQKADLIKPGGAGGSLPGWLSRVSTARTERPASAKLEAEDHFVIEGEMR